MVLPHLYLHALLLSAYASKYTGVEYLHQQPPIPNPNLTCLQPLGIKYKPVRLVAVDITQSDRVHRC